MIKAGYVQLQYPKPVEILDRLDRRRRQELHVPGRAVADVDVAISGARVDLFQGLGGAGREAPGIPGLREDAEAVDTSSAVAQVRRADPLPTPPSEVGGDAVRPAIVR